MNRPIAAVESGNVRVTSAVRNRFTGSDIVTIGIAMMLIGGSAIRAGQMTIGDFFQYFAFTAMITMPVIFLLSFSSLT